jgi:lysophospholipase L1-like esterase
LQPSPPAIVSPAPSPPAAAPWIAAPRPWSSAKWLAQHDEFVAQSRRGPYDVVFLGDSIAAFFATRGAAVWERDIAPLGTVADFGIEGDRTQFVLWRVQHGELDATNARVVVLMAGTNNLASATPESVARGIAADVAAVRAALPNAVVILNAIWPRGAKDAPARAAAATANAQIASLADGITVRWVDTGNAFLLPDGTIDRTLMPDALHPNEAGYDVWSAALRPALAAALAAPDQRASGRERRGSGRSIQR